MEEVHLSRWFYTEGVNSLKTLIQFFQLFSQDLKDNPSVPPGRCSITSPSVVWAGGELNVSTTSLTGESGTRRHLAAVKIAAGVLIHHPRRHHVALQYANVATACPRCHLVLSFISLPPPLSSSSPWGQGFPPPVICTFLTICGGGWKWCQGWCWN